MVFGNVCLIATTEPLSLEINNDVLDKLVEPSSSYFPKNDVRMTPEWNEPAPLPQTAILLPTPSALTLPGTPLHCLHACCYL